MSNQLPSSKILIHQFLQTLSMRNCSQRTVRGWRYILERFAAWCGERSIDCVSEVTPEIMAASVQSVPLPQPAHRQAAEVRYPGALPGTDPQLINSQPLRERT
jgi:site-specific recombinase XerD